MVWLNKLKCPEYIPPYKVLQKVRSGVHLNVSLHHLLVCSSLVFYSCLKGEARNKRDNKAEASKLHEDAAGSCECEYVGISVRVCVHVCVSLSSC